MFESLPSDRERRWELLTEFLAHWFSPLAPGDGFDEATLDAAESRLAVSLPAALREWYELAGRRDDVWSRQDELLAPQELSIEDGVLIFYIENQCVVRWGIRLSELDLADPPVVIESDEAPRGWLTENTSISEFALQMLVFSVKWSKRNRCWANGGADEAAVRQVEASYARLAFPDWHWPTYPTRLYGLRNLVIQIDGEGDNAWLWACSRDEKEFRGLEAILGETGFRWDSSSDEWPAGWLSSPDDP